MPHPILFIKNISIYRTNMLYIRKQLHLTMVRNEGSYMANLLCEIWYFIMIFDCVGKTCLPSNILRNKKSRQNSITQSCKVHIMRCISPAIQKQPLNFHNSLLYDGCTAQLALYLHIFPHNITLTMHSVFFSMLFHFTFTVHLTVFWLSLLLSLKA